MERGAIGQDSSWERAGAGWKYSEFLNSEFALRELRVRAGKA